VVASIGRVADVSRRWPVKLGGDMLSSKEKMGEGQEWSRREVGRLWCHLYARRGRDLRGLGREAVDGEWASFKISVSTVSVWEVVRRDTITGEEEV
jgi:hypothetical protein